MGNGTQAVGDPTPEQLVARRRLAIVRTGLGVAAAIWAVASVLLVAYAQASPGKLSLRDGIAWVFISWTILPPIWFFIEFGWLWPPTATEFDRLKHGQDLAKNIWAGVLVLLGALYFKGV